MKILELRKKTDEQLIKLKKELKFNLVRSYCKWSSDKDKDAEKLMKTTGTAKMGKKTKLSQNIKRTIAQINTILNERSRITPETQKGGQNQRKWINGCLLC